MKLTIGRKLGLAFGVVLLFMMTSSLISYWKLRDIVKIQDAVLHVRMPSIERMRSLQRDLNNSGLASRRVVLAAGQTERRATAAPMQDAAWLAVNQESRTCRD